MRSNINVSNVPVELKKQAEQIAKEQGKPLAQVLKDLLREWVAEQQQKLPTPTK
jgi:hypothetical protein